MRERSETELINEMSEQRRTGAAMAVFVHSPFCGTCKLAERMLDVLEAHDPSLPIVKANINLIPELRERWRIASVPALVFVKNGEREDGLYAFRSVVHLHDWLQRRLKQA